MKDLKAQPTTHNRAGPVYVPDALATCSHVFIRNDAVRRPFQKPYNGPYEVISRTRKTVLVALATICT